MNDNISFPFLLLSRELRDKIYDDLLTSSRVLPSWPEDRGHWRSPSEDDARVFEDCRYAVEGLQNDTAALQRSCHQVHEEVRTAIARLDRLGQLPFRLDLMMVDETTLYPTWLSFPARLSQIPKLNVDVRILGDVAGKRSGWTPGCGGPPIMVWCLYYLLKRFLLRGPDFLSSVKSVTIPYVQELVINVVTPSPVPPEGFLTEDNDDWTFRAQRRKGLMHPEVLLSLMMHHMQHLLCRSRYTAKYASIVFARIERITFSRDGDQKQSWDLPTLQPDV
ncbi:MAG: hypothetical protein Q9202_006775 [Teloschistes flavicans]